MARLFDAVSGSHPAAKSRSPYSVFRIIRGVYVCMYSYTQPYTPVPTQASQPTLVRSLSSALYQRCASLHPHKHVDKQRLGITCFYVLCRKRASNLLGVVFSSDGREGRLTGSS